MSRIFLAGLIGAVSCGALLAAEPGPRQHVAEFEVVEVDANGGQRVLCEPMILMIEGQEATFVTGGTPGKRIEITISTVADSQPTQYVTQFKLIEKAPRGKPTILAAPRLVTAADRRGMVMIGQENGPRMEYYVIVRELRRVERE